MGVKALMLITLNQQSHFFMYLLLTCVEDKVVSYVDLLSKLYRKQLIVLYNVCLILSEDN